MSSVEAAYAIGSFMSNVRPDIWSTPSKALNFLIDAVEEIGDNPDGFVSTAGFTVRAENDETVVSLDFGHLYSDGDAMSFLTEDYRDLFNI